MLKVHRWRFQQVIYSSSRQSHLFFSLRSLEMSFVVPAISIISHQTWLSPPMLSAYPRTSTYQRLSLGSLSLVCMQHSSSPGVFFPLPSLLLRHPFPVFIFRNIFYHFPLFLNRYSQSRETSKYINQHENSLLWSTGLKKTNTQLKYTFEWDRHFNSKGFVMKMKWY